MSLKDLKGAVAYPEPASCEVWVCRSGNDGFYEMFKGECSPKQNVDGNYVCKCKDGASNEHSITYFCPTLFKQYTGLPHHMRKGTRKKVRWIYPLQFMDNKVEVK